MPGILAPLRRVVTDDHGGFSTTLLWGPYRLGVTLHDAAWGKGGRDVFASEELVVAAGQEVRRTFRIDRRSLRVRLLDAGGKPLALTQTRLRTSRAWPFLGHVQWQRTDEQGWLVVDPAPTVEVRLLLWPDKLKTEAARKLWSKENPEQDVWEQMVEAGRARMPDGQSRAEVTVRMSRRR